MTLLLVFDNRFLYAAKGLSMNPDTCLIIGALVYFATIALNRFLGERNYSSLAKDDKLKLVDAFSRHRTLATYIPIGIMLVVIVIGFTNPQTFIVAFPIGVVLVLVVSLALQVAIFRRLTTLSLPDDYVAKFRVQSVLVQIGSIVANPILRRGAANDLTLQLGWIARSAMDQCFELGN